MSKFYWPSVLWAVYNSFNSEVSLVLLTSVAFFLSDFTSDSSEKDNISFSSSKPLIPLVESILRRG